jgi:hypothetical protein
MKPKTTLVALAVGSIIALVGCVGYLGKIFGEATMSGPFEGEPYLTEIITSPSSSLPLPSGSSLSVHWEASSTNPIVALRRAAGTLAWAQVLLPQRKSDTKPMGHITRLSLHNIKTATNGFKVKVYCYWTGGGDEFGLIYLDQDYKFQHFALSW